MTRPLCGAVWFLMAIFDRGISHAEPGTAAHRSAPAWLSLADRRLNYQASSAGTMRQAVTRHLPGDDDGARLLLRGQRFLHTMRCRYIENT